MSFEGNTRRKVIPLASQAKGATNPLRWDVPKYGLLAGIFLQISGSIAGTLSAPNALGKASIVRNVRVITNSGLDLINISGAGYHYLLRNHIEDYVGDPLAQSDARSAVVAGAFNLDMWLPITLNNRDSLGLFPLQNEASLVQIEVTFEADASVATGATVTATVVPNVVILTVPVKSEDWPPLNTVHQILEDQRAIAATGDYDYSWPRGNTYVQVLHGMGIGATPAENWTRARLMVNQSETLLDFTPGSLTMEYNMFHGIARIVGTIPIDLMGSSGLGCYGTSRDLLFSALVTELITRIAISATGTLYTVRRQLVLVQA